MKQLRIRNIPFLGKIVRVDPQNASLYVPGGLFFHSNLSAEVIRGDGKREKYDFGSGLVTNAGVAFMANDFANVTPGTNEITNFNFHGSGTGTTAEAVTQTALVTEVESRVAGTQTSPAAGQARTVATISYTATRAITEWGLFSASTAGTMWDRRLFTAINVVSGDSIQFTYTLTINAGG